MDISSMVSKFEPKILGSDVIMKKGIHPTYQKCEVTCVCGNTFVTRSTVSSIKLEICSACHPFFTGKQKMVDSTGRVDRFNKKYGMKKA